MKIYIAGKITGDDDYKKKFSKCFNLLKKCGYTPISPSCLPPGFEHSEYMHICYSMIDVCSGVLFLKGWNDSKGAVMEMKYAIDKGKKIFHSVVDIQRHMEEVFKGNA